MSDNDRIIQRVHFIGVGGSGVSGLAMMAHQQGMAVTGSDAGHSKYLQTLIDAGLDVTVGHDAKLVCDPALDIVVVSTAIPQTNPELAAANAKGLEVWQRARFLAYLARGKKLLAVTGTHGKTTTSSMLACALHALRADPSFLIGGIVDGFDVTARLGSGEYFVVEADESDGSFIWFNPDVEIITNIESDHMDHYDSIEQINEAFRGFIGNLRPGGRIFYCADDPGAATLLAKTIVPAPRADHPDASRSHDDRMGDRGRSFLQEHPNSASTSDLPAPRRGEHCSPASIPAPAGASSSASTSSPHAASSSYGTSASSDYRTEIRGISSCTVTCPDGQQVALDLPNAPGHHNMLNATSVFAVLDALGFERVAAAEALKAYSGVRRRFDRIGTIGNITVVDDYGHHPTEIAATLATARGLGFDQIHMVFQPHRYTRTKALFQEFTTAFAQATTLVIMPIYSAGEQPIAGIDAQTLQAAVSTQTPAVAVTYLESDAQIIAHLKSITTNPPATPTGDATTPANILIITQGAGSITNLAPLIVEALRADVDR